MKISFVTTVLNEEKTIRLLFKSLYNQTRLPDEIIIVDGGSSDSTIKVLDSLVNSFARTVKVKVLVKSGNRAVGRNEAIRVAHGEVILISDAGCILKEDWVERMVEKFKDKKVDVVAGYYEGKAETVFQKCLVPYVLVMPDKVDPQNFLPASRSMGFRKSIWKKVSGFPEEYSHNEDYIFARRLRETGAKIFFQKEAVVNWIPRETFKKAFVMFFRFAYGDTEAGIIREKVLLLFARYIFGIYVAILAVLYRSSFITIFLIGVLLMYVFWSIKKNYRYVRNAETAVKELTPTLSLKEREKAVLYLPLLQFTSDIAVLSGSSLGFTKSFIQFLKHNPLLLLIVFLYALIVLRTITWGTPNTYHPFAYYMDEWHSLQSVRFTFKEGTPNIWGAAHGFMFYFFQAGLWLIPFGFFVNPLSIKSTVLNLALQQKLFIVLRLNTLFFGISSIVLLAVLLKRLSHKIDERGTLGTLSILFFAFTPMWLTLSNYFKYDIAVVFSIIASLSSIFYYAQNPTRIRYALAGIVCMLTLAIKVSNAPILVIYLLSFFFFPFQKKAWYKTLFTGLIVFVMTFLLFAIPDVLMRRGSYADLFYVVLVQAPGTDSNYNLGQDYRSYLLLQEFPAIFGHALAVGFLLSFIVLVYFFITAFRKGTLSSLRQELFIVIAFFLYCGSLIPLGLGAGGNRALGLLPFIILIVYFAVDNIFRYLSQFWRRIVLFLLALGLCLQVVESYAWLSVKYSPDPRETSSQWININVPKGTVIGIENIPLYEMLPDIVVKEFYWKQYNIPTKSMYQYLVVGRDTPKLPAIVIITNGESEMKYIKKSAKKDLLARLHSEKYTEIARFSPEFRYYRYFNTEIDFVMSDLIVMPTSIVIYKKIP